MTPFTEPHQTRNLGCFWNCDWFVMQAQPYTDTVFGKGGQISESLALWFKSQKKGAKLQPWASGSSL